MTYEADLRTHYRAVHKRLAVFHVPIKHEEKVEPIHVVVIPPAIINPIVRGRIPQAARFVAAQYDVSIDAMMSPSRKAKLVLVRHIAIWMCCKCEGQSLAKVGRYFRRDHTSVLYARNKIQNKISKDSKFSTEMQMLVNHLNERNSSVIPKWMYRNGGVRHGLADQSTSS